MENEITDPIVFRSLSENQKKLVAVLPIPSAILSLIGSSIIVYMGLQSRKNPSKKWTPYNRLVTAMSFFDIITSITLGLASFLYPKETSDKAWVFGNETTCSAVGFFQQLLYAVILYYGSLSVYFVLTARFGFSNKQVAKRIEPFMHIFCFGYPLVTAFVGLFLSAYSEPEIGLGCWVKRWPKRCVSHREPIGSEEKCRSEVVGWILGGWVGVSVFVLALLNTVILFIHVRRQEQKAKALERQATRTKGDERLDRPSLYKTEMLKYEEEEKSDALITSVRTVPPRTNSTDDLADQSRQLKRLKLVRTQALLYFLSFFLTSGTSQLPRLIESFPDTAVDEKELPYNFYGLVLAQCILYPLQGFTNMLVYIRPKYLAIATENPKESRLWVFKRAVFGRDDNIDTSGRDGDNNDELQKSEDDTRKPSSADGTEVPSIPSPNQPTKKAVSAGGASVASVSSVATGSEEMKEVMERAKRRLERYKADRLTKESSDRSLKEGYEPGSPPADMMSPIAKVRAKLKLESAGFSNPLDDFDEPRPVPEFSGGPSIRGKGGTGPSTIRMDGSIVAAAADSSGFSN